MYSQTNPKKVHPHLAIVTVSVVLRPKEGLLLCVWRLLNGLGTIGIRIFSICVCACMHARTLWCLNRSACEYVGVLDSRLDDVSALSRLSLPPKSATKTELPNESLRSHGLHQLVPNTELSDASDNTFIRSDLCVCVCVSD